MVNVANGLTALRLALVPVFMVLVAASEMVQPGWRIIACLTFAFASMTDLLDGWIARRWSLVTSFGKVADPIADKALTGSALVLLAWYHRLPWWVTLVILGREFGVTLIRFWVIRYGVIAASRGGKIKTGLQVLAIVWYLWPVPSGGGRDRAVAHGRRGCGDRVDRARLCGPSGAATSTGRLRATGTASRAAASPEAPPQCGGLPARPPPASLTQARPGGKGAARRLRWAAAAAQLSAAVRVRWCTRSTSGGQTLATVESLTGGLLAATIVDVAGVSSVFRGGLVVYATELKAVLAGVPEDLLAARGPVDPEVAVALAQGGRIRCGADWCLATTGVAGPEPQGDKPVGLVFVAVAGPGGAAVRRLDLEGGRVAIRDGTVVAVLQLLADQLSAAPVADRTR